ncbi:hypothetical protein JW930_06340 [Candidatus Woesearchaeota archaeon]|nr:hypothetical protein [Candidatus Woesearchaeota archaeon]
MGYKKQDIFVIMVFVLAVCARTYVALQTDYFNDDQSYFALRQIEHIKEKGTPLFKDLLNQREYYSLPTLYYLLTGFSFLLPMNIVAKIILNILASSSSIIIYLISLKLTRNRTASILSSILSAFFPLYIGETTNNITIYSVAIPLLLLSLLFFYKIDSQNHTPYGFLTSLILLIIFSQISFLFIFGLLCYSLLCYIEKIRQSKEEIEIIFFGFFFFLWTNFIVYKKAFQVHGIRMIWQNIPSGLLQHFFFKIGILEALYSVGVLPIILGIFVVYQYLFKKKSQQMYVIIGLLIGTFILFWFRFVSVILALIIMGNCLIILSSQAFKDIMLYINKTKISSYKNILLGIIFTICLLTSILPSIWYGLSSLGDVPNNVEIDAYKWIKNTTDNTAIVLTPFDKGILVNYFAERPNVIDYNFLSFSDANLRFNDTETMYSTQYKISALSLLNKYSIEYIYLDQDIREQYNISAIKYIDDNCFDQVYSKESVKVYRVLCKQLTTK